MIRMTLWSYTTLTDSAALRSLKRQLAKVVYRHLVADHATRLANLS